MTPASNKNRTIYADETNPDSQFDLASNTVPKTGGRPGAGIDSRVGGASENSSDATAQKRFAHIPFLDGLRAWAIFSVLAFHSCGPVGEFLTKRGGWLGVDAFFVISGFLITSILLNEQHRTKQISLKQFYKRRALRLMPVYFLFIAVSFFLKPPQCHTYWAAAGTAALYMVDYDLALGWGNVYGSGLEIGWSLGVEEKFYLLWPTLMKLVRKHLIGIGLFSIIACLAWKAYLIVHLNDVQPFPNFRLGAAFDTKIDSIMMGCLAALALANPKVKTWLQKYFSHGLLSAALFAALALYMRGAGYAGAVHGLSSRLMFFDVRLPLFTFLFACLIVSLSLNQNSLVAKFFSLRPIAWVGKVSYSLYLWHMVAFIGTMLFIFNNTMPSSRAFLELTSYAVALVLAAISYYGIEKPFLRMKDRFGS